MSTYRNPEPVPSASQLTVLPFLAAVDGYLRDASEAVALRTTIHRVMSRESAGYLQQACAYITDKGLGSQDQVGRTFPVNFGVMGAAYGNRRIWRTKHYDNPHALLSDLRDDLTKQGQPVEKASKLPPSYLAIPFLGPHGGVVMILYSECGSFNFFADDTRVQHVTDMCNGFCRLLDSLQREPFENLRNFPLQIGDPVEEKPTVFEKLQEPLDSPSPPTLATVSSFNYEAAAA